MMKSLPLLCLFTTLPCFANSSFIGVDYFHSDIEISDESANTGMAAFRLGTSIYKQIAIKGQYISGNQTDNIYNMEFDLENSKAAFILLQSYAVNGFSLDVSLGYASTQMTASGPENTFNGTDEYNGFAWGVSLYQEIPSFKNARVKLGYQSLYNDSDLSITGISLGFNYHF
ncbi:MULTISPECIES: outer membrane beta-barrel protein [unclassified Pseudoalteromonas]|uniref:outer membrane beta-barrel protein n=1 Tax=unclassified Pseudoalteromonas TaxID=194690 RepID=UPI000B05994A|nr:MULTISPECIES: outer membrane beta-barrel protein [unclassified Pseudoalteromonas]